MPTLRPVNILDVTVTSTANTEVRTAIYVISHDSNDGPRSDEGDTILGRNVWKHRKQLIVIFFRRDENLSLATMQNEQKVAWGIEGWPAAWRVCGHSHSKH